MCGLAGWPDFSRRPGRDEPCLCNCVTITMANRAKLRHLMSCMEKRVVLDALVIISLFSPSISFQATPHQCSETSCLKKIRKHVTTYICPQRHKCKARDLRASSTIPEAVQERYKYKGDSARGDRREDSACHSRLATGYDYGGTYRAKGAVHITDEVCARYSATPPLKHS